MSLFRRQLVVLAMLLGSLSFTGIESSAHAAKGFIVYGFGDHIADGGTIPQTFLEKHPEYPSGFRIGWKYGYFDVFWCNVWTWSGQHVLYREAGDSWEYFDLSDEDVAGLRASGADLQLGVPFEYTVPPGLLVLLVVIGLWVLLRRLRAGPSA
jgi:hypothetical protein